MVMLLRVVNNMAKVLVIRGIKETQILISSRFASFVYALYFCHGPGEPNSLEFHLVKLWMKNMTESRRQVTREVLQCVLFKISHTFHRAVIYSVCHSSL